MINTTYKKLTERECRLTFRRDILPEVLETCTTDDIIAINEEYSTYTNYLCKEGLITTELNQHIGAYYEN